jgi:hypothetical protein
MRERWKKGKSPQQMGQLFNRNHSSISRILAETEGTAPYCSCNSARPRGRVEPGGGNSACTKLRYVVGGRIHRPWLVEQALLRGIELFAAGTEFPTLEHRDLVGQLFDAGRAPDLLALLGTQRAVGIGKRASNSRANARNSASPSWSSCWIGSLLSMGERVPNTAAMGYWRMPGLNRPAPVLPPQASVMAPYSPRRCQGRPSLKISQRRNPSGLASPVVECRIDNRGLQQVVVCLGR